MKANELKVAGSGAVLPASGGNGTLPPGAEVLIDGFDDSGHIRCVYPGDVVKHHQAETVEELGAKVANQLRAKFGTQEVKFQSAPKAIGPGERFVVEA